MPFLPGGPEAGQAPMPEPVSERATLRTFATSDLSFFASWALAEIKPLHVGCACRPRPQCGGRGPRVPKHAHKNQQDVCHRSFLPRRSVKIGPASGAMHIWTAPSAWKMDGRMHPIARGLRSAANQNMTAG